MNFPASVVHPVSRLTASLTLIGVVALQGPAAASPRPIAPPALAATTNAKGTDASNSNANVTNANVTNDKKRRVSMKPSREVATLAGGCFWCLDAVFKELKGVERVVSGYAGGRVRNPSYQQVCSGNSGHAEVVQITFDPTEASYHELLEVFFTIHDPTTMNRQGADVGTQYRSAIFYHSPQQKQTAEQVIREIEAKKIWDGKIVTEVAPFTDFYAAEDYHQDYYAQNPDQAYCQVVIAPKVAKFRKKFVEQLKR